MIPRQFSLALGGGGGRGWAHIGVARALDEAGLHPRLIVGTSMGAVIGAGMAAGVAPREIERIVRSTPVKTLFGRRAHLALFDPRPALDVVTRALGDPRIEDLPTRFAVSAYDLVSGRTVAITSGRVIDALERTIAVPIYFPPHPDGEAVWCDAGLWHSVPVKLARSLSADPVIGVWVQSAKPAFLARPPVALALRWGSRRLAARPEMRTTAAAHLTARTYMALLAARLADPVEEEMPDLLIRPSLGGTPPWQLSAVRLMIERGYQGTAQALARAGGPEPVTPTEEPHGAAVTHAA